MKLISVFFNFFVNDFQTFISDKDKIICINCDELEHLSRDCFNKTLSFNEKAVLRSLILSDRSFNQSQVFSSFESLTSSLISSEDSSANAHSITYEMSLMSLIDSVSSAVEVLIKEFFDSNKRAHVKKSLISSAASLNKSSQSIFSIQSVIFVIQLNAFLKNSLVDVKRLKKKDQRRIEKAAIMTFLVELLNEKNDTINKTIFIK